MNTTTTTPSVELVAFLVPNSLQTYQSVYFQDSLDAALGSLGLKVTNPDAVLAQVRIEEETGRRENFTDHGWGEEMCKLLGIEFDPEHPRYQERCAPWLLPVGILRNMKEGDVQDFVAPSGAIVRLKFKQLLEGRYNWFGPFEELLQKLLARFHEREIA